MEWYQETVFRPEERYAVSEKAGDQNGSKSYDRLRIYLEKQKQSTQLFLFSDILEWEEARLNTWYW